MSFQSARKVPELSILPSPQYSNNLHTNPKPILRMQQSESDGKADVPSANLPSFDQAMQHLKELTRFGNHNQPDLCDTLLALYSKLERAHDTHLISERKQTAITDFFRK